MSNDEIFRFALVRNPEKIVSEKLKYSVIPIVESDFEDHPICVKLEKLKNDSSSREEYIKTAQGFQYLDLFLENLNKLETSLSELTEWIYSVNKITIEEVRNKIVEIFKLSDRFELNDIVEREDFRKDKIIISDSLVLTSIINTGFSGLSTILMQLRRVIFLLEYFAKQENKDKLNTRILKRILSATLVLPDEIFPIPDNNDKIKEEKDKEIEKSIEEYEKETTRINTALEEMNKNEKAIDELTNTYNKHLFDVKLEGLAFDDDSGESLKKSLSLLPAAKFNKLNDDTKQIILNKVGSSESVDVKFVVNNLEKDNAKLGSIVASAKNTWSKSSKIAFSKHCGVCMVSESKPTKEPNRFISGTRGKVETFKVLDLLMVRQTLLKYKPGEIAHIENILKGESKKKEHRSLNRKEETIFEETESITETEEELQTTDRYELQNEVEKVVMEDHSAEAGVTFTKDWLTASIEAYGNYAYNRATDTRNFSASNLAKEIVSRSLKKINERVLQRRSTTRISEVEIINTHEFNNKEGSENVTGIYKWVDKYYQAQLVSYGKRAMVEFMIPEPAAFYRFASNEKSRLEAALNKPEEPGFCINGIFHKLKPEDLDIETYTCFVAKYNVRNVEPPPARYISISDVLSHENDKVNHPEVISINKENDDLEIPTGYFPKKVSYQISGSNAHSHFYGRNPDNNIYVCITLDKKKRFVWYKNEIGQSDNDTWHDFDQNIELGKNPHLHSTETSLGSFMKGEISDEFVVEDENANRVNTTITGHTTLPLSVSVHYTILCERKPEIYKQWQINTFNAIIEAYRVQLLDYNDALQSQSFGFEGEQGRNPALNREIEQMELKKYAVSILTGQQFESFNAMEEPPPWGYPQINIADAEEEGKHVGFFEQAFEWRLMMYLFYPYFWGRKDGWVDVLNLKDVDSLFEKFLKAGYARVWVPVRPEFEKAVANFLKTGTIPDDKETAVCNDNSPILSIIDEIKEQMNNDFEQREGSITISTGEKKVVGYDTDFSKEDVDREILINLGTYRIAKVISKTELELREPYQGENIEESGIGVALGVKYVGEPWMVRVPTTLVFLQDNNLLK